MNNKSIIICGLLLLGAVLLAGQKSAQPSTVGRYMSVPSSQASGGVYITDTATGATRFVIGRFQGDTKPSPFGVPFEQLP